MTVRTASFAALGTTATVGVTEGRALARVRELVVRQLDLLDRACSRFRDDSELARVNGSAGRANEVSPLLAAAVRVALDAARATDGLVDPTLGAQLAAAGYDRTFALVRERERWRVRLNPSPGGGWRSVRLDRRTLCVPPGVELDLGATAKAWAADRCAAAAARLGRCGVLVSLGGDVAVAGEAPPGGWPVLVTDDHAAGLAASGPVVAVESGGLATSSTTVRRWPTDEGGAHHLLDPRTGSPVRGAWRTATVAAHSCLGANVAATAAIVLGSTAGDWLAERGLPARLVDRDGRAVLVGSWPLEAAA